MDYNDTISYLYAQLPVYQKYGASAIKKDLTNIRLLCKGLDNPHADYPVIHVAGTNGKGTVSHLISSYLQTIGLKVGLYTSPHYRDFRERIKVNGQWIEQQEVVDFVASCKNDIDQIIPSFFEITVAMAFEYFRMSRVDIAVIETGLGGRLDSTNIVAPLISVITNISLDHTDMLGDTIYKIAHEKAGIIKKNTPVIIGEYQSECDAVFFDKAAECNSPIEFASLKWSYEPSNSDNIKLYSGSISLEVLSKNESPFYMKNVITALAVIQKYEEIHGTAVDIDQVVESINSYRQISNYMGRWQIIDQRPLIITDSAHNKNALATVMHHLMSIKYRKLHLILGFVKGKDVQGIFDCLPINAEYHFVSPNIFRGLDVNNLKSIALTHGRNGQTYGSVGEAYEIVKENADPNDLIYIGGSSFVVGDLLDYLAKS